MIPFEQTKRELWLQYADKETYLNGEAELFDMLKDSDGQDIVVIFCKKEKAVKRLAVNKSVNADKLLLNKLTNYLGESCVKVIEKPIENLC